MPVYKESILYSENFILGEIQINDILNYILDKNEN